MVPELRSLTHWMGRHRIVLILLGSLLAGGWALSQDQRAGLADLLGGEPAMASEGARGRVVRMMQEVERARRVEARREGRRRGLLERGVLPGGRVVEMVDWVGGQPVYATTSNTSAAVSSGADRLWDAPYGLSGAGVVVGVWDGGAVRASHQEFGGRVVLRNEVAAIDHATHVAGTLAAAGEVALARGMAGGVVIESYDWNSDISEMTARAATAPGDPGRLYLSNHSYNYIGGWDYVGAAGRVWEWHGSGSGTTAIEDDFGRYNTYARDTDSLAFNAPYFLMVRSAGNDRSDEPGIGEMVALSPGGAGVAYNPAVHPKGDGSYRGGFDTISFNALAKNVLTVGSVADAVQDGLRAITLASMSAYTSWGPTDDGRIKPDVVANGEGVYSTTSGGNDAYGDLSGTSMAAPSVCGAAALLIELYGKRFPGQAMRASTLKGLLIHTATDLGHPGPDYKFGWGLIDVKSAADLIQGVYEVPDRPALIEGALTAGDGTRMHSFAWDGVSPIRATLSWTDPAGEATLTSDSRTPRLVNNLNLKVVAPGGGDHYPYVMPFVGTWTQAAMDAPATTGVNTTDPVEQVRVAAPPAPGIYQAVVTHSGTLSNGGQPYSLMLSGTAPAGPMPPTVAAVSPETAEGGVVEMGISGSSFAAGATVTLALTGQPVVTAAVSAVTPSLIQASVPVTGMASGRWDVVVTNSDGLSGSLPAGFAVVGTLEARNFDSGAPGWTTNASLGTTQWVLSTSQSHTPAAAWFASGPSTRNTDNLVSEAMAIPADASRLRLSFWHRYALESGNDGGVLEFSINGGTWFQVANNGSAESLIEGGYPLVLNNPVGPASSKNQLAGKAAWSGNTGSSFSRVVVAMHDSAKYAGTSLRARWRLATNDSVASPGGWYVDSVTLTGVAGVINHPPSVLVEASATPAAVTGTAAVLGVSATDDGGESGLTYTWSATGGVFSRPVVFSENGTAAARTTVATFAVAGQYTMHVWVRDAAGLTATSQTDVMVEPVASGLRVEPGAATVAVGDSQVFGAGWLDQFGDAMPGVGPLDWTTDGGGTIDAAGVFTAHTAGGPFQVGATGDGMTGGAAVTVVPATASVALVGLNQTYDGTPRAVGVVTEPTGLAVRVTYDGSEDPPVDFGSYAVVAVVVDPNYLGSVEGELAIVGQSLAAWRAARFTEVEAAAGLAADDEDFDGDGLSNLAEYALGSNPRKPTPPMGGGLEDDGLAMVFTRPKALPDVVYLAESSADLHNWTPLPLVVVADGPVQTVRMVDTAAATAGRRFLRLRVARSPGNASRP